MTRQQPLAFDFEDLLIDPVEDETAIAFEAVRKNLAAAEARMEKLLKLAAEEIRPCAKCGATLYFIRHQHHRPGERGAKTPYTVDGSNHFTNCPHAEHFSKRRREGGGR